MAKATAKKWAAYKGLSQGGLERFIKYSSLIASGSGAMQEAAKGKKTYGMSGLGHKKGEEGRTARGQKFSDVDKRGLSSLLEEEQNIGKYLMETADYSYDPLKPWESSGKRIKAEREATRKAKLAKKEDVESLLKAIQSRESEVRSRRAAPALAQTRGSLL